MRYKVADAAYTALKMARQIKDAVNIEYKEVNNVIEGTLGFGTNEVGSVSAFAHPLCLPEYGTQENERVGDSIKLQRLSGRGTVTLQGTNTTCMARLVIFRCDNPNQAIFPVGDFAVTDPNIRLFSGTGVLEPKYEETKYLTKFLYDKTFMLDSAKTHLIKFNLNMPLNWHQKFVSGDTAIMNGGLYLAVVSDHLVSLGNDFYFRYQVSYTDD